MKKMLNISIIIILLIAVSLGLIAIAYTESQQVHHDYAVLPVPLIGTWRGIDFTHRIYVFCEDGTMVAGNIGGVFGDRFRQYNWYIVGDQLHTTRTTRDRPFNYSFEGYVLVVAEQGSYGRVVRTTRCFLQ